MVLLGPTDPTNKTVIFGEDNVKAYAADIETATNMYPGRLVSPGSTADTQVVVGAVGNNVVGWLGYEHTTPAYRPATRGTIYTATDYPAILRGSGFGVLARLAAPWIAFKGDLAIPWGSQGEVAPAYSCGGGEAILRIPFTKNASEADTSVDLPANMTVVDVGIEVTTAVASGTIDVGLLSTEASGDADGFLDALSAATAGIYWGGPTLTTGSNEVYVSAATKGALLTDTFTAGSDAVEDVGTYFPTTHRIDGTTVSISYTTSSHSIIGNILVKVQMAGLRPVGTFFKGADASSAAVNCQILSDL